LVFANAGTSLPMDPLLMLSFTINHMLEENLIKLFLFVQGSVKESTTDVPRVRVRISSEKVSQVASIWVNVKILSLFNGSIS
jgi:hypothetical protein